MKTESWTERKENLSRFDISAQIPAWKKAKETEWLKEVNSQSLQSALANLDAAYVRFFREKKGFPKFKSKHYHQSFQVPQHGKVGDGFVQIPKVGKIKAVIDRGCVGPIKNITISRSPTGKFFASVLCEDGDKVPVKLPITDDGTVGIDLGLKSFAVLSTGERIANPQFLKKSLKVLRRQSRVLSRRKKGSNNYNKARSKLAAAHEKISNQRSDFLHKITTRLVRDNQTNTFAIEDLAVANMVRNPRLARSISDVGWGEFRRQLEYKAEKLGKTVLVIGRFEPSSKTCSCGKVNRELKLSDRKWSCVCGAVHDRDLLAANNIKQFALHPRNKSIAGDTGEFTPVEIVVRRSLKQEFEPARNRTTKKSWNPQQHNQ